MATMEPAPDPIDEDEYPGDIEGDVQVELSQVQQGFIERMNAERERFLNATSSGFYFVAVFEDANQCDVFMREAGLDRGGNLYIDGRVLADLLKIALPPGNVRYNTGKASAALSAFVRKPKLKGGSHA